LGCFDNYITISESIAESRSGLYATDLPGIDVSMLDGIAKAITEDHDDIFATIYKRATRNLVSDISKQIQNKFYVDLKLVSRQTSQYLATSNNGSSPAGVTIEYSLPKYAKVHIQSVSVYSSSDYPSGDVLRIYDTDENGELLDTITTAISAGRNTINIDADYEVDKIFISYNPASYSFRKTENKYFAGYNYASFDKIVCNECLYGDPDFSSSVVQVSGGGVDVKYHVLCSIEKFVCENLKLYEDCLLYKIGYEITVERRLGERLNQYTILSQERWQELENFYKAQYEQNIMNAVKSQNIPEDMYCFACKNTVRTETLLP
jgi:hypothetical protein